MEAAVQEILDAILAEQLDTLGHLDVPESYRGITVHADETEMFADIPTREKDPRKSLHLDEVPTPEPGPGEVLVAVMASAINYNTVWTSIFEPMPTFGFLQRYGRLSPLTKRHDLPYHVVGSDLAGVVLRAGDGVNLWKAGDRVVAHCLSVELESPDGHNDTMMDPQQRIWGFETNFTAWRSWRWSSPTSSSPSRATSRGRRRPAPAWSTPPPTGSSSPATEPT